MKKNNIILTLVLLIIMISFCLAVEAQSDVYKWKILMSEPPGNSTVVFTERWIKLVEEKSNGRVEFNTIPYGALAGMSDLVELVQMGEGDMVTIDPGWLGSYIPQAMVFNLHYIWPKDNLLDVSYEVFKNGQIIPLLDEYTRKKNLKILSMYGGGWMNISSNVPIRHPEDTKGLKHRVMGNVMLVNAYNVYGFSSQVLDPGELYGALQNKLIDSQYNPIFFIESMSFHEVQDYITNIFNEYYLLIPIVNDERFDNLPKDLQKIFIESAIELIKPMTTWAFEASEKSAENIKKSKPNITIYELTDEEIIPFEELAKKDDRVVKWYLENGGDGANEVLDTLLTDIENAQNKY
jgi:TRAP-type C4-dicarboxylate transport system substrate-binding protein